MKFIEWILRVAVAGEFTGHGVFAIQGKEAWIGWIQQLTGADASLAAQLLFVVGIIDLIIALIILIRPISVIVLWAAIWGFWTALIRPIVGEPIWDFIERWANWGAPLALFFIIRLKLSCDVNEKLRESRKQEGKTGIPDAFKF